MQIAGHAYQVLSPDEVSLIHRSALRILAEMGLEVHNRTLLKRLAAIGAHVDYDSQRARFPAGLVERFIADADKFDWEAMAPQVSASAGVYHSLYHDPASNQLVPWTEASLASYFALARRLPHVGRATMLGSRLPVPAPLEPLYERYYCWKYGAVESGSILDDALCPYLHELYEIAAAAQSVAPAELFRAAVYLVPPLRLGRFEAYQVAYFWERGLRVRVGDMFTMGATCPATLAGAVTLNLAEQLALRLLDWALWGERRLHIAASIAVMDMRTTIRPFGRPEMALANVMTAQLARFYGASCHGHAGLSDAKLPSAESGAQKMLSAIPTLLASGSLWIDAGLLAIDEVCSPIQLVLDAEILSALSHVAQGYDVSEETIGLETILEAGPGGQYLDKLHTRRHHRREHWQPRLWSRHMLGAWMLGGRRLDADLAREVVLDLQAQDTSAMQMPEQFERNVLALIERAQRALVG